MEKYHEARLWLESLGCESEVGTRKIWRGRLTESFEAMRRQAIPLSREISSDLPNFTVHDETHIDALWEIAGIVAGEQISLNPVEAFLFGAACLCHDLAMSVAAYPGGRDEIRQLPLFLQGAAILYPVKAVAELDEVEKRRIDLWVVRENHAAQARRLPTMRWKNSADGAEHGLIEDTEIAQFFSHRIGQFAESHWWPLERIFRELTGNPGPPGGLPPEWKIDEFKIAALLRAADAAHIDNRRAPSFLFTLRHLSGLSADHWKFQNRLSVPDVVGNRLKYSSSRPFDTTDADAWWTCYDTINMINAELSGIDDYQQEHRPFARFTARSVAGAHNPEELGRTVRVVNWMPVDARPMISDVALLIDRLGGSQLYGNQQLVPLRELLQNAIDATDALLLDNPESAALARIECSLQQLGSKTVLVVRDNGIGMNKATLIGCLLDFGSSLWRSELLRREFPRLLERRFKAIGKYGIGFFSVFMWGQNVQVITRTHGSRDDETLVLEFKEGLKERPILRAANSDEVRRIGGTTVRLEVSDKTVFSVQGSYGNSEVLPLTKLVPFLLPFPTVHVSVVDGHHTASLEPLDWRTADVNIVIDRVAGPYVRSTSSVPEALIDIVEPDGRTVGRAMLRPSYRSRKEAVVIGPGGLRIGALAACIGVFAGETIDAARDKASVSATPGALKTWADKQATLLSKLLGRDDQMAIAEHVASLGGHVDGLCIARTRDGVMNLPEIRSWARGREWIVVATGVFDDREGDPMVLGKNTIFIDFGSTEFRSSLGWSPQRQSSELPSGNTRLALIREAVIQAWASEGYGDGQERDDAIYDVDVAEYESSGVPWDDTADAVLVRDPSVSLSR